nr:hypothetical protein [Rhizobium sp.]
MISRRALLSQASLLLAASVLPAEAAKARNPKPPSGQVYLFRGFADIFSTGLNTLAQQLKADGVNAQVMSLPSAESFARKIADRYRA